MQGRWKGSKLHSGTREHVAVAGVACESVLAPLDGLAPAHTFDDLDVGTLIVGCAYRAFE